MPIVVSDTSPLRALQHLRLIDILEPMYGQVFVPQAVADELGVAGRRFPALDLSPYPFIHIENPTNTVRLAEMRKLKLDPGEAAAILLALEKPASLILLDERIGRQVASSLGLLSVGVVGVLIEAKQRGLIVSIASLIHRLQTEIDFHLSASFIAEALRLAGE